MDLSLEAMAMGLAVAHDRYKSAVNRGNPVQAERLLRQMDEIEARITQHLQAQRDHMEDAGAGDGECEGI